MSNKKALIAMSGGVDSSVAAYLMQQAGFDCVGGTMLLTDCIPGADCHAEENIRRASAVAKRLGIPFHVFSFSREFRQYVMEPFVSCYESGGTPTPVWDATSISNSGCCWTKPWSWAATTSSPVIM